MKNENKKKIDWKRFRLFAVTMTLAAALAFGLALQQTEARGATIYYGYMAGIEQQATAYTMLGKVNAARQSVSTAALKWDTALENAAVDRAKEIAIYFSHTRPNGAAWNTVLPRLNAENIYVGYRATADTANSGWMSSAGHRANRLNSAYKSYGAAAFQGKDGAVYWVELFSTTASTSTVFRGVDVAKTDIMVRITDSYLSPRSYMTNLSQGNIADTDLRVGGSYYMTLKNCNKQFTASYTTFSRGYFSSANTTIATIDIATGKVTARRAGVEKLYGRTASASGLQLSREVVVRPQAVTGLIVTPKVDAVSLKWSPLAGASGFEILRSTSQTGTYARVASVSAAATTYTNTGLPTGTTYYYKVRAYVLKSGSTTRYCGYGSTAVAAKVL